VQQWSPALWQAAHRGNHATVLRLARTELNWTQDELGRRFGASASTISRLESGRRPLRDIATLRRLATILDLPPEAFGLAARGDTATRSSRTSGGNSHRVDRVTPLPAEEDDPVRRRAFLQLTGLAGATLAWPSPASAAQIDPAQVLTDSLGDVLLTSATAAEPAPIAVLAEALTSAQREFTACHYLPLAYRLPALITAAEASAGQHHDPSVQRILAESYNLATRALIKLEASGLEWLSADRALRAARTSESPLTLAEAQRLVASVARRAGHHERAQNLTLAAASHLDTTSTRPAPEHLAMHGTLHLSAAYAAARAGDRDRANELLTEAEATTARLIDDRDRHRTLVANLVSHRVSAAFVLGDAGIALAHARSLPLEAVPTTERRARLLVDTAQAWAQWDKPEMAYRTLLTAERTAPGEIRTRSTVRRLVTNLMGSPKQAAMPGLPALAKRVHAIACG
jgi:transcriptional regulator with XRE-family HTH domain